MNDKVAVALGNLLIMIYYLISSETSEKDKQVCDSHCMFWIMTPFQVIKVANNQNVAIEFH